MKESMWMYLFMMIGIFGIVLINLFGQVIVSNEQNYYLLKEVTRSAMLESVDYNAYRMGVGWDEEDYEPDPELIHCVPLVPGTIRIIKEDFINNFMREFSNNAKLNKKYRVEIHEIVECPPRVSISVVSSQDFSFVSFFNSSLGGEAEIVNSLTGILENKPYYDE